MKRKKLENALFWLNVAGFFLLLGIVTGFFAYNWGVLGISKVIGAIMFFACTGVDVWLFVVERNIVKQLEEMTQTSDEVTEDVQDSGQE